MSLYDAAELNDFLQALGYLEAPMAMLYTHEEPVGGFSPQPGDLPTLEKEQAGQIDWGAVFGNFSCVLGNVWRARRKHSLAWFSAQRFGCPGGAFYLGYLGPQTDAICAYVSSGIPGAMQGENYISDPQTCRRIFEEMAPPLAGGAYCVFKPLDLLEPEETPELVMFFARPEVISGLHFLATYVSGDLSAVSSPFGAGCSHVVSFARQHAAKGERKAVLGGWDPSCRKYYKTDEISFSLPWPFFLEMLGKWRKSFLTTGTWQICRKKIARSQRAWGEV